MDIKVYGSTVQITQNTILKTRQWFIDNCKECIKQTLTGEIRVNEPQYYVEYMKVASADYASGKYDTCLSFIQKCYYIQTGKSVPLLS